MSFDYAELLFKRAKMFFESSESSFSSERLDVAVVEAEIAAQLALKALVVKLGFEPPRTRSVRQLFSFIIDNRLLPSSELEEIKNFTKFDREKLILIERARAIGQYGGSLVDRDEAEIIINCAKEVIALVEKYWGIFS